MKALRYARATWLLGSWGLVLLLFSLVLVPSGTSLADDGGGGELAPPCAGLLCQTVNCYRLGFNVCNKPGNECSQQKNKQFCGGCICTPNEPDPCECK